MRNYIKIVDIEARDPERANRVRVRDVMKRRRQRNSPEKRAQVMRQGVKDEAKRKGVQFDLSLAWFQVRLDAGICEMTGMAFDFEKTGTGRTAHNAPSIDRVVHGGDYTVANCRMVLFALNRALSDVGEDRMVAIFKAVIARRG